jgi:DNA-binding NtrC family response regulator
MKPKARILVVDDERSVALLVGVVLRNAGYDTLTTEQGAQAAEWLKTGTEQFDLMITDLRMSPVDGFKLLALAKQARPSLPVLFLTAHLSDEISDKAAALGAFELIQKPFGVPALVSVVQRALGSAPPLAGAAG